MVPGTNWLRFCCSSSKYPGRRMDWLSVSQPSFLDWGLGVQSFTAGYKWPSCIIQGRWGVQRERATLRKVDSCKNGPDHMSSFSVFLEFIISVSLFIPHLSPHLQPQVPIRGFDFERQHHVMEKRLGWVSGGLGYNLPHICGSQFQGKLDSLFAYLNSQCLY